MRIAVIGAGISGLSIARMLLEKGHEVIVYEKDNRPGGMIKCDRIGGGLFHRTGGHVFNTHESEVADWFWSHFDIDREFSKHERHSVILFGNGRIIDYPVENHVYQLDDNTLRSFINDMCQISSQYKDEIDNFDEFLYKKFGKTLYDLYFQPYNTKVWQSDLKSIPLSWLEGKLPMPDVEEILFNNIRQVEEKQFVHSSFHYPIEGGSQFIANRLAEGINIYYNIPINKIELLDGKWQVCNQIYDAVVFCGNIKLLPMILSGVDIDGYTKEINELAYHGTTSVFCEISKENYSWVYLPDKSYCPHRIIYTGNFASSNNKEGRMTGTIEITDNVSDEDLLNHINRIPFFTKYLSHHYEKYTYPIQDARTRNMIGSIKKRLFDRNFYLCGRFAEWEYYNMDMCIKSALELISSPPFQN